MLAGAAAVMLAFGAGYVIADRSGPVRVIRSAAFQRLPAAVAPARSARGSAPSPEHPLLAARSMRDITPIGALATGAAASIQPPIEDRPLARAAITNAVLAPDVPAHVSESVREEISQDDADVSPPLAFDGTAMFSHDGQSGDARHALDSAPSGADDLRVMTIADDGAKNEHVQPSPDGRHIAFDSDRDGERGVYIANRDGTNVQRVSGPGYAAVPTWSPDSTQLAFVRNESKNRQVWNLWLLTIASGQSRRLTAFSSGETWSASWFPDGRRIAYSHDDQVVVRDLVSGAVAEYPSPVARERVRAPAVSPDGRYVIFQVARSGAWLLDLREGFMRRVPIDSTAEAFAWSPDGRRVAYHIRRDGHWGVWPVTTS